MSFLLSCEGNNWHTSDMDSRLRGAEVASDFCLFFFCFPSLTPKHLSHQHKQRLLKFLNTWIRNCQIVSAIFVGNLYNHWLRAECRFNLLLIEVFHYDLRSSLSESSAFFTIRHGSADGALWANYWEVKLLPPEAVACFIRPGRCDIFNVFYSNNFLCLSSISLSFFFCHFTYFLIRSSSNPTVLTQYPRDQKCRPQNFLPTLSYFWKSLNAIFPFKNPIKADTEYLGGIETMRWTWSTWTFNSKTSTKSFWRHKIYICCLMYSAISSCKIFLRYFGQNTTW